MKYLKKRTIEFIIMNILIFSCILVGVYLFLTYSSIPVNRDAGYYIPISKAVLNGATPTVNVDTSYTPFVYYVYAMWMYLWGTSFEGIVLLNYIVNILNSFLLYLVLARFVESKVLRLLLCISYYLSIMICQGYTIVLEPFQLIFVLFAINLYLSHIEGLLKYCFIGLLLGISIMFKQYSVFFLLGLLLTICIDNSTIRSKTERLSALLLVTLFSSLPFLSFVITTNANLFDCLYSCFLNKSAVAYTAAEHAGLSGTLMDMAIKIVHLNWIFAPVFLYGYFAILRREGLKNTRVVLPLLFCSCVPILVKQLGHYFQLIAPWSYLLWGIILKDAVNEPMKQHNNIPILISASISFFILLPCFLLWTPSFYEIPHLQMGFIIFLIMLSVLIVLALGAYFSKWTFNKHTVTVVLAVVFGLESMFLSLKIPFAEMEKVRRAQVSQANKINTVFKKGSPVLVIDYPQLYVICDFINPLGDYSFIKRHNIDKRIHSIRWDDINNIILRKRNPLIQFETLNKLGFRQVNTYWNSKLAFFSKSKD